MGPRLDTQLRVQVEGCRPPCVADSFGLGKSPLKTSFRGYSQSFRAFEGFVRWELRSLDTGSGRGIQIQAVGYRRWDTGWGQLSIESHISAITRFVHDLHGFCTLAIKIWRLIAGLGPSLGAG